MGLAKRGKKPRAGRFVGIPYHVANSDIFSKLSAYEVKLLFDLSRQFNGRNNGNLTATLTLMEGWGWASGTLHRTQKSLLEKGFITVTRQVSMAITFDPLSAIKIDPPTIMFYSFFALIDSFHLQA